MIPVLDNFLKDVAAHPTEPVKEVSLDISNDPRINQDLLKQKIIHNIEMSDEELMALIKESYEDILSCIFEMNDLQYLQFVSTPRFINCLSGIISSQRDIKHITKIHINKLIYDYITYNDSKVDAYLNTLMVNLGTIVNQDNIRKLIGIGVNSSLADFIALARYSNMTEAVNIRRVNFIICTALDKEFNMNDTISRAAAEQMVVNIYSKLFNRLTILFEATMFDCYNLDESWVTESVSEMYSITTLAVLDILNNMPLTDIRALLITYTGDFKSVYAPQGYTTRISLRSLSGDYDRIRMIVEGLESEHIYVP